MKSFEKDWQKRFNRFAQAHDEDHLVSGWSHSGLYRRLSLFKDILTEQQIAPGSRILDLGCGSGTYTRFLSGRGYRAVGLDYSLYSLQRVQTATKEIAGSYLGGDAYSLPFKDESFDSLISIGVLQAMGEPEKALKEMSRVLKSEGIIIIEFLNGLELLALVKTMFYRIRGLGWRVRTYSPFYIKSLFDKYGFNTLNRSGVYLPPRSFPSLGRIINLRSVRFFLEGIPGISLIGAHAFLLVGKKTPLILDD